MSTVAGNPNFKYIFTKHNPCFLVWYLYLSLNLNNHFYFTKTSNVHLQSERKGVHETWEALSFKKGKLDLNVGVPNVSLGTVLNADWNIESLFTINLSCRNGDDDIEVGHCDSSGERGWPREKRPVCGQEGCRNPNPWQWLGKAISGDEGTRHLALGVGCGRTGVGCGRDELQFMVQDIPTKLCLLIWGDKGAGNIEGGWGQKPE